MATPAAITRTAAKLQQDQQTLAQAGLSIDLVDVFDSTKSSRPEEGETDKILLNTYAIYRLIEYQKIQAIDLGLLWDFQDDFNGWTKEQFAIIHQGIKRAIRNHLLDHGIYLSPSANSHINANLHKLLEIDEDGPLPEWKNEVLQLWAKQGRLHQKCDAYRIAHNMPVFTLDELRAPTATTAHLEATPTPAVMANIPRFAQTPSVTPAPDTKQTLQTGGTTLPQTTVNLSQPVPSGVPNPSQSLLQPLIQDAYSTLPPTRVNNGNLDPNAAATFGKLWQKENNYTGDAYDILDDKIRYFLDVCRTVQIQPDQFHAVFSMILTGKAKEYFIYQVDRRLTFADMYTKMKMHFDTEVNRQQYHTDWTSLTFASIRAEACKTEPNITSQAVLEKLLNRLQLCQRALGDGYAGEQQLIANVARSCQGISEFKLAFYNPAASFEGLASQMRSSLAIEETSRTTNQFIADHTSAEPLQSGNINPTDDQWFTDRKFSYNRSRGGRARGRYGRFTNNGNRNWQKKCYICYKPGCWSTKHTQAERDEHKRRWVQDRRFQGQEYSSRAFFAFLADYEGDSESNDDDEDHDEYDDGAITQYLLDESTRHRLIAPEQFPDHAQCDGKQINETADTSALQLHLWLMDIYSGLVFQGIMPDTGAARKSTGGHEQFEALKKELPGLTLDAVRAGEASIRFGNGDPIESVGTTDIRTPIGTITFHILPTATPFLFCLEDMDKMGVLLDNVDNIIVRKSDGLTLPVTRKFGHPWFFTRPSLPKGDVFLTEAELRRLHKRFGHPSVGRLHRVLQRAGHDDVEYEALKMIKKFCHHCQIKGSAPQRFKFKLEKDDVDFNHEIVVDIMYLDGDPVLHVVDDATAFQAARFLSSISAKETWEKLKQCWIDTYLGPPDIISHDAGTNFDSNEFRSEARIHGITVHQVPVEAHWSIGKGERYHAMLDRAYSIIHAETRGTISKESCLQAAVSAINNTAGPNGLIPTLLVFGAYPRVSMDSPPAPSQLQRAAAIRAAMNELRKIVAKRRVNDTLATRNGPTAAGTLPMALPIGSEVRVFREKKGWSGPFRVLAVSDSDVTVELDNGPATFRSTTVMPYYRHPDGIVVPAENASQEKLQDTMRSIPEDNPTTAENDLPRPVEEEEAPVPFEYPQPRKAKPRGRPRKTPVTETVQKRPRGRPRKIPTPQRAHTTSTDRTDPEWIPVPASAFVSAKEKEAEKLAVILRKEGKIRTPGVPFELSDETETNALIQRGVLQPVVLTPHQLTKVKVFGLRMVHEIKGRSEQPYEKSRLVLQGYDDPDKTTIVTQSPTILRCSQRLILAIAPTLVHGKCFIMLRDISQAYTQSDHDVRREIFAKIPENLQGMFPAGAIFKIVKPLYGLAEAGAYWFDTYQRHHVSNLHMQQSCYDPCLLISNEKKEFGIAGLQTDDTINIGTQEFLDKEDAELVKAKFIAKPQRILKIGDTVDFNGSRIAIMPDAILTTQKDQAEKLAIVDVKAKAADRLQQYIEQRARGAYIASICQPEATFDYSSAAQVKDPVEKDVTALNKRIKWQIENKYRGIRTIRLNLAIAKLYVFVDGSFANNADLTSQIGFVIVLGTEKRPENENAFELTGNLIHWSSTKCKRITRSVLASEIYGMSSGFDYGYVISTTIATIVNRLGQETPPSLVLCTDSKSLYQCLVQLGTTTEKRLMIDVMGLRQSYERREIDEIRWINGHDNPADAMTKATPNQALERLVSYNKIDIRMEGWVQR